MKFRIIPTKFKKGIPAIGPQQRRELMSKPEEFRQVIKSVIS